MAACRQWLRLGKYRSLGRGFCSLDRAWRQAAGRGAGEKGRAKLLFVDSTGWTMRVFWVGVLGFFLTLFCSVIAPDGSGFSPGNGKAVLMLSWFSEEHSLQTSCGLRVTSVTCSRFLTRGGPFFSPMPASSSRAAPTGANKPVFSGFFSCGDFNPWWALLVESVRVTVW